jgi:hypothetical protein
MQSIVTYCDWDIFLNDYGEPPQEHIEWGQTQATVHPVTFPSADWVSPSSGSGRARRSGRCILMLSSFSVSSLARLVST